MEPQLATRAQRWCHRCCSTSKADISTWELRRLYKAVHRANRVTGSPTKQQFFDHWRETSDAKLQLLLDKSVAVCAAFVRDGRLYEGEAAAAAADNDGADSCSKQPGSDLAAAAGRVSEPGSQLWGSWGWRQPRQLVGFVRAAGDSALVATIHDCLIHPDLQGFGLGGVLIKRVVQQVSSEGVYDVGLVTPAQLQSFFRSCSFELDHEGSVPMALQLQGQQPQSADAINSRLQSDALQRLLQAAVDGQQRRQVPTHGSNG